MGERQNTTALRFPPELHQRLRDEADQRGVSIQWLVSRLLAEGLEALIPAAEFRLTNPAANGSSAVKDRTKYEDEGAGFYASAEPTGGSRPEGVHVAAALAAGGSFTSGEG